ncbi:MAG: alpha/beta fold hydrolase [Alphaproteobacteria bacterium]|nr:alpha/beta fold hydrolase [Alphaproteobacteria bacterium]
MFGFFNNKVFNKGFLPEFEGHKIYYQEVGNPKGEPVLFFHGGPGGCAKTNHAEYFNLKKQRIIMFDQRGCNRSEFEDITTLNDTRRLIKDAKRLLEHLNINEPVIVSGVSWGSTLALLFAEKYPELTKQLALFSIFLARKQDRDWVLKNSALFYPDLLEEIYRQCEGENPYAHYAKKIFSEDLGAIQTAIKYMVHYEYQLGKLDAKFDDVRIDNNIINSARINLYYAANRYFLEENEILNNIEKIKHIPTLIVHNRLDMCCPLQGAWELYRSLDNAQIEIIADLGHGGKKLKNAAKKHF